jgi:large subunit ribosomal protein L22
MEYKAIHHHADMSPRKIRPFASLIRGRPADEALELLRFLPNKSARLLEQVLKSALGNAEDRGARNIDDLIVVESCVDGGPTMKRIMPRARGTAYQIKRR